MAAKMTWQETKRAGGASVAFAGPPPSPMRAWMGASAIFTAVLFAYLSYLAPHPKPVTQESLFRLAPIVLVIAGISLVWSEMPGVSAGTLDIDRERIRIVATAWWRLQIDVPVRTIDSVSSETEEEDASGNGRFRVRVTTRQGGNERSRRSPTPTPRSSWPNASKRSSTAHARSRSRRDHALRFQPHFTLRSWSLLVSSVAQ